VKTLRERVMRATIVICNDNLYQ